VVLTAPKSSVTKSIEELASKFMSADDRRRK
jgi:hypothetical protein